jgi:acyl-CoA thioesterase
LSFGQFYNREGKLVASASQESLMRLMKSQK